MRYVAEQLGRNDRARTKFGRARCSRHPINEHQFSVRATVHEHGRHAYQRSTVAGNLPLEFDRICTIDPLHWQPELRGVDIKERSRAHRISLPQYRDEFTLPIFPSRIIHAFARGHARVQLIQELYDTTGSQCSTAERMCRPINRTA